MSNITTLRHVQDNLRAAGFDVALHTLTSSCKWYRIPIDVECIGYRAKRYIIFKRDARRLEQIHTGVVISKGKQL